MRLALELPYVVERIEIFTNQGKQTSKLSKKEIKQFSDKAAQLAAGHSAPGCASDAFFGVSEALKIKGREIAYMATMGLPGGCGEMTRGTCGALLGVSCAIGLSYGLDIKKNNELREDIKNMVPFYRKKMPKLRYIMFNKILDVVDRVTEKYGGTTCADIQFNRHGQALDLRDPRIREKWHVDIQKCTDIESDFAAWGTEAILKSTSWDERLKEWTFPLTCIERGSQFIEEQKGYRLPPRFKPGKYLGPTEFYWQKQLRKRTRKK